MNGNAIRKILFVAMLVVLTAGLSGCNVLTRMWEVGREPTLSGIENPTEQSGYQPVSMPMPAPQIAQDNPNSLWRPGAKAFFKDIRAKEVGDILTVRLALDDKAKLENNTTRERDDGEKQEVNTMLGYEASFNHVVGNEAVAQGGTLFDFGTKHETKGDGGIDRSEEIDLKVAAMVTQVLPNGALAIIGSQEVRVNYELRQLKITGIIRPQDIDADNSISHERIAEMRMAYGGRGTLSDLQQPRWGTQIWDALFPF
jgi:flagellar L-ring protein precursor FlgH